MAVVDKIILTNVSALKQKYKTSGYAAIKRAVSDLIAADAGRGIQSKFIALDDPEAMSKLGASAVSQSDDPRQNKVAIDGLHQALTPDYVLLLGADDVIPHQDIRNPLYSSAADGDDDVYAWGDIPYACDTAYSKDPSKFLGPTRVVGRLPDIRGGDDPAYLVTLIKTAETWRSVSRREMSEHFAVSAEVWIGSTRLSVSTVFGNDNSLKSSPPDARPWSAAELKSRMHFFNCHGANRSAEFYGQEVADPNQYPVALRASDLKGKVAEGAVIAAECCYGGQLYAPSNASDLSIVNTYLLNKAHGMFASTTIAYGPATGNGSADLICQYFLSSVLSGASLGRAALEARQRFVRQASPLDPADRKTLAQFNLYGDPSIQPVQIAKSRVGAKGLTAANAAAGDRAARHDRRRRLVREGAHLARAEPALLRVKTRPPRGAAQVLSEAAQADNLTPGVTMTFKVKPRAGTVPKVAGPALADDLPTAFHVMVCSDRPAASSQASVAKSVRSRAKRAEAADPQRRPPSIVLWIGKEVNGEVVSVTKLHSR